MPSMLYGDMMSQPFRACAVLCRVAGLDVREVQVQIAKGQTRAPEFLAMAPLGKVPVLKDGDLVVVESPSIMRYLCETRGLPDHWLPSDPGPRSRVSSAMDWHLGNLRIGSMLCVWHRVLSANLGQPGNERLVADYGLPTLRNALKAINDVWLGPGRDFVGGGRQPSIADLLMACEVEMLRLLDAAEQGPNFEELLAPFPVVMDWLARVAAACAPHYQVVHAVLHKARERMLARRQRASKL